MERTHFKCPRHGGIFPMADYFAHMRDSHEGRHDCVLSLTPDMAHALIDGATASEVIARFG